MSAKPEVATVIENYILGSKYRHAKMSNPPLLKFYQEILKRARELSRGCLDC
jgi:hypothetical protein